MGPRQKKNAEDIESVYEKRADRIAARAVDGNSVVMSVDPVDALPVKSLAGELHYRSTAMSKALGMLLAQRLIYTFTCVYEGVIQLNKS
jgi:hypothetical protein